MRGSYRLGNAFGIGIFVHWSFGLLLAYVLISAVASGVGWVIAFNGILFVLAVFACVVLHELGHSLAARHYGIGTHDITLLPIGGVARLVRMPENPRQEIVIAIAGPAVNVAIAALLALLAFLFGRAHPGPVMALSNNTAMLYALIYANVILVVFNMIPAFPMDGGRVLRAFLALRRGMLDGTEIAVTIGRVFAVAMFVSGFFLSPILFITAIFIYLAGAAELQAVRLRYRDTTDPLREMLRRAMGPFAVEGGVVVDEPVGEPRKVRGRVVEP